MIISVGWYVSGRRRVRVIGGVDQRTVQFRENGALHEVTERYFARTFKRARKQSA